MALMNRISWHHSGGSYTPGKVDLKAYHAAIDGDGDEHKGKFDIEANAPGQIRKGHYAAHTRALNTGTIGPAICAMGGRDQTWADPFGGKYPVKPAQVDGLVRFMARQALHYGIPVDRRHILSHAEVPITLGVWQRNKWDFDYDPRGRHSNRDPIAIGDEIRQEVILQMNGAVPAPAEEEQPVLRQGSTGDDVAILQAALGIKDDGIFGPITRKSVVSFQRKNGLLDDGVVKPMTWAALLGVQA